MTQDTLPDTENVPSIPAEPTARARKVASPRPKKSAKTIEPVEVVLPLLTQEVAFESKNEWPEPDEATSGGTSVSQTDSAKRKRRRRKGKGTTNNTPSTSPELLTEEAPVAHISSHPPIQQRAKIDPVLLTKMAWKIFLAEVSEEGVALIGDQDAKDLSRRCFRLAEIFIEEQSRRR